MNHDRKVYSVQNYGKVIFRGFTPQGWPMVNLITDRPGFGTLTIQGEQGEKLKREIEAAERE